MVPIRRFLYLPLLIIVTLLFSCAKDPLNGDQDIQALLDYGIAESEFTQIRSLFDLSAQHPSALKQMQALFCPCIQWSIVEKNGDLYEMSIDYGEEGCVCVDGRTRKGKLIGTFEGNWDSEDAVLRIVPENYRVILLNKVEYAVDFQKTLKRSGWNGEIPAYEVEVRQGEFRSEAYSFTWEARQTITWIEGVADLDPLNNVYQIEGSGSGTDSNGLAFTVEVASPMIFALSCPHVKSGVLTITPEEKAVRRVDFGEGDCDNKATVSIDVFSMEISLY